MAFLRHTAELTGGTYRVELLWVVADDVHAVASTALGGAGRRGRSTSSRRCCVEDGQWTNIRAQPLDQPAFDASGPPPLT